MAAVMTKDGLVVGLIPEEKPVEKPTPVVATTKRIRKAKE